jgi:hypothetical protein
MKLIRVGFALVAVLLAVLFSFPALAQDNGSGGPISDQTAYDSAAPNNTNRQQGDYASARLIETRLDTEGTEQSGVQKQVYDGDPERPVEGQAHHDLKRRGIKPVPD